MIKHRRRFVAKKKNKKKLLKIILIFFIIGILYSFFLTITSKYTLATSNQEFIKMLIQDSNHYMKYDDVSNIEKFLTWISNTNVNKPVSILENVFGHKYNNEQLVYSEETEPIDLNLENYIEDPNPVDINNPRVYIYNTHQLEAYSSTNFEEYNITPNVMMASYLLKEKLNKLGVSTIVETSSITDFLSINGWDYASSYKASRFYLLDTVNKYPNIELIIDLHRDSINRMLSTTEINGKRYAKVLFVVGLEHSNYEANLNIANKLNEMIKSKYPTLSRGIIKKSGAGVNGIYNQDIAGYSVLIECGGVENSIEEVMNTIEVLSNVIYEYLGGANET